MDKWPTAMLATAILVLTAVCSGCIEDIDAGGEIISAVMTFETGADKAINITDLGLDQDSIANLTQATFIVNMEIKLPTKKLATTKHEVFIVDGKLEVQPARCISIGPEEKERYMFEIRYQVISDDPDIRNLTLIGAPGSGNKVTGIFYIPKKKNFDEKGWLKIEDVEEDDGSITMVDQRKCNTCPDNYRFDLTMPPYNQVVMFERAGMMPC